MVIYGIIKLALVDKMFLMCIDLNIILLGL